MTKFIYNYFDKVRGPYTPKKVKFILRILLLLGMITSDLYGEFIIYVGNEDAYIGNVCIPRVSTTFIILLIANANNCDSYDSKYSLGKRFATEAFHAWPEYAELSGMDLDGDFVECNSEGIWISILHDHPINLLES